MYVGTKHTSTAMGVTRVERTCQSCSRRGWIEVAAEGVGTAHSPYFLDANAGARAADGAEEELSSDARMSAGLLPCANCNARDPDAVRRAWRRGVRPGLLLFPVVLVVALLATGAVAVSLLPASHGSNEPMPLWFWSSPMASLVAAVGVTSLVAQRNYQRLVARAEGAAAWVLGEPAPSAR